VTINCSFERDASPAEAARVYILHVFPSFGIGGVPLRIVRVINYLGSRCRHTIVALDGDLGAGARISRTVECELIAGKGGRMVSSVIRSGRYIAAARPDVLLTYNWGSIEWALANTFWCHRRHIHFESGFGVEEAFHQIWRRVLARRVALQASEKVVVPSRTLERVALDTWRLPKDKLRYIPNGIEVAPVAGFRKPAGPAEAKITIGTVAPLRAEKNVGRLIRAFSLITSLPRLRLVIMGDGAERTKLEELAADLGVAARISFRGNVVVTPSVLNELDIFCLSSDTEQMPNALLEAMAAGLPVAAVDVGDVRAMVAPENREFIVDRDDLYAFARAIGSLAENGPLRCELGTLNRQKAQSEYSEAQMYVAYERLLLAANGEK
jgi:L-malate glycosyltransferase